MPRNSFTAKQLRVKFTLAGTNQVFPGTNSNELTLTDFRITAQVQSVARQAVQASVQVYGMKQADMNALTVAWANPPVVLDHRVTLEANDGSGWSQVFDGTIIEAQPDYRGSPRVFFGVVAMVGYITKTKAAPATSYQETTDIGAVVGDLAERMGFDFVNGGADAILAGPLYLHGSLYDQLVAACRAAKADFYFQGRTLLITAGGKPRNQAPSVVLNRATGLIGYPVYERAGLIVQAIYDAAFACATPVDIESVVPSATGRWFPYSLTHTLESRTPGGEWTTELKCLRVLV